MRERVAGATGADGTEAFARLLRELKDRSGLSYGVIAKRLHMSTSTLHRYCNGTAVPVEYAPVERIARVCRATPQELVELHQRWILADAARGSGRAADAAGVAEAAPTVDPDEPVNPVELVDPVDPVVLGTPNTPTPPRRRRNVLIASVAAAAVLGAVVLAVSPSFGSGNDAGGHVPAGDTPLITGTLATEDPSASPSPSSPSSPGATGTRPSKSASPSATASENAGSGTSKGAGDDTTAVPIAVGVRPYVYEEPCSQHFLVDSEPEQVGPPATEQDAKRWAAAYGAVSSGEQRVALTVQGTGEDTVVLEALHIRVLTKGAPLVWNDYSMGVGCGGGVGTKSFDIDLDQGSPTVDVKNGQRDFPYKVSESDPEVFYVSAHAKAHDVRWELALDWSSGDRSGTVRVDNDGNPFRTSADVNRPGYDYPLGGSEWIERVGG